MTDREILWRKIVLKTQACFICARDNEQEKFLAAQADLARLVEQWKEKN